MSSTVIYLNGTASAGKTSIARGLQKALPDPYLHFAFDDFVGLLPEDLLNDWDFMEKYPNFKRAFEKTVYVWASLGHNVIVDNILNKTRLKEAVQILEGIRVFFIGVTCPLEVLEQREASRPDREVGWARSQINSVHKPGIYDLSVDTDLYSSEECVCHIVKRIQFGPEPDAFLKLQEQFRE